MKQLRGADRQIKNTPRQSIWCYGGLSLAVLLLFVVVELVETRLIAQDVENNLSDLTNN